MSFFISDAMAQEASAGLGGLPGMDLLFFVVLILVFYFLLIRPQSKRAKEHKRMVAELAKGDEVVTSGGLLGKVRDIGESFVLIEVATGIEVKVQKHAIASLMPKGTIKSS